MSERYILAYFKSPEEAEGVARKLRALRVIEISIDRFSRYGANLNAGINPVTGSAAYMATLHANDPYTRVLSAADPSASGMSHGGDGGPTGRDILLTVIVDSESYDQVLRLIVEAGGLI